MRTSRRLTAEQGAERLQEPPEGVPEAARGLPLAVPARTAASGVLTSQGELLEAAQEFAQAAKSRATRRAYACDLRDFDAWCAAAGAGSAAGRVGDGRPLRHPPGRSGSAASTIQRRLAAISQVHQLAGHVPPPTADWEVRQVVQGIRRRLGTAPAQKEAGSPPPCGA